MNGIASGILLRLGPHRLGVARDQIAQRRVAIVPLLQCADRIGSEQLLLTQEFLAEMLGVRRTTMTLLAQELQKRGVVRYSRGRITILDRPALEACACECYNAIKHENLSPADWF